MSEHLVVKVKAGGSSNSWVINETFSKSSESRDIKISFTSNDKAFSQISIGGDSSQYYGLIYSEPNSDGIWEPTFPLNSGWTVDGYRTVNFNEPVTDESLLSWLQENAVNLNDTLSTSNHIQVKVVNSKQSKLYAKIKSDKPQRSIINKTWIANKTITLPENIKDYNIDFYYYGTDAGAKRTSPKIQLSSTGITYGASGEYSEYQAYSSNAWKDNFCDVISITSGADASNDSLISFLESNGRFVDTLQSLNDTTWTLLSSTQIRPFSDAETALYNLKSITTTDKFQVSGDYILYYGKSMYMPVTYNNGSVDLANGTNIWSDGNNLNYWWYRRSDMDAQQYKNLAMQPVIQITGGSSTSVLRVINYFQKNGALFDGDFIEAGTYKWVNSPAIRELYVNDSNIYVLNFNCDWHDVANDVEYKNKEFVGINIRYVNNIYWLYFVDTAGAYCYAGYISTNASMDGRVSNPVISLKSPVSKIFKTWFLTNTSKI